MGVFKVTIVADDGVLVLNLCYRALSYHALSYHRCGWRCVGVEPVLPCP